MKYNIYLLIFLIVSCNNPKDKNNTPVNKENNTTQIIQNIAKEIGTTQIVQNIKKDICWTGTIDSNIPVFLHYQIENNLIIGEITYLNTKDKKPIKIIGTNDNGYHNAIEFEKNGNITGTIIGKPTNDTFKGFWTSPNTGKSFQLELTKSDSIIHSKPIKPQLDDIYGEYKYQYGPSGYQGDFVLTKIDEQKASFNVFSVTRAPARNIADVGPDTIELNTTKFIYNIPETNDCEFEVQFYKDFLYINYTKGYCEAEFGLNATIDGIFIKTK